ncbi:MAG: adenylate/guanylate cyclase domain-containing protein [Roseiflexaceae bacterium]
MASLTAPTIELLREHLPAPVIADLVRGLAPDPAVVADICTQLCDELNALASYIPGALVRRQLATPEPGRVSGGYWDGSILFADLSGFTAMSGKLSVLGKQGSEEVSAIINRLFGSLVAEIYRYDGELFKFGGDALTAFFDARQLGRDHAIRAVRSALAMQEQMNVFRAVETRAGTFPLRLRVGVHSGRVFAAEVGSMEHIELVVTGRNINRVAEAQEIADPGEVVVSNDTLQLIPGLQAPERGTGFHLVERLPMGIPSTRLRPPAWTLGAADLDELVALAQRLAALRPYLPYRLPRRYLDPSSSEQGEFRPVTVIFANFYPFSEALTLLGEDFESASAVLNAYYQRAQSIVHRYGGIVNKVDMYTRGDKLMALFGAPIAHEDDAERATRCALDLHGVLKEANDEIYPIMQRAAGRLIAVDPEFLHQKIGINTGVVFAGQVGSALRHEYTVMGQPVNLAARLMGVAKTGSVVLSPATRKIVEANIVVQDLPPVQLKGIPEPVPIAEALSTQAGSSSRSQSSRRTEIVGRDSELEQLINLARNALVIHGRVIALVGETGIGKSRLIGELVGRLLDPKVNTTGFFPCIAECQSYDQNTPYAAIRQVLEALFGLAGDLQHNTRRLDRLVQDYAPNLVRFAPLLGDILGLGLPESQLTSALSPEQRHDRALELIDALVLGLARHQAVMLILDDMHWADASSIELLMRLARLTERSPLLLLFVYRSDQVAEPWVELPNCVRMVLGELSSDSSAQLMREFLASDLPSGLEQLLEKTQGNPFFIEAVMTSLVESGALVRTEQGWQYTRPLNEAAIPDSIEGVITARLDRLPDPLRETVQVAAVVGRRFSYSILDGVVAQRAGLPERLEQLQRTDLVAREHDAYDPNFHFTHALTRDVAYEGILFARRRDLHRRVAARIEELYGERIEEQAPLLARHYLLAEEWLRALDYHIRAGAQAEAAFANREAIALFERGIQIIHELETRRTTMGEQVKAPPKEVIINLYERLGGIHTLLGEYDTAEDRFESALYVLGQQADAPPEATARVLYGLARVDEKRAQFDSAFERVSEALQLLAGLPSQEHVRCLLLGAGLHQRLGRYVPSREAGEQALLMAEQIASPREQANALKLLGGTLRNMGDNQRAFEHLTRSLALYQQVQDLDGLGYAYNDLANTCFDLGRLADARRYYEAGAEIKQAIGDIYGQALIANNLGDLLKLQGQIDDAISQYASALMIFERLGSRYACGVLHMNLGSAHLQRNDLVSAEAHLTPSANLFREIGAEDFLPELERYQAELELRRGNLSLAAICCEQALATAIRLEARSEEGITRRLLAEILARAGNPVAAWSELSQSQSILRDAAAPHELARTLVAIAALALDLDQESVGRAALAEAIPILEETDAVRDLGVAQTIARRYQA